MFVDGSTTSKTISTNLTPLESCKQKHKARQSQIYSKIKLLLNEMSCGEFAIEYKSDFIPSTLWKETKNLLETEDLEVQVIEHGNKLHWFVTDLQIKKYLGLVLDI